MAKCICPSDFDVPVQVCQPIVNPNISGGQRVMFEPWFNAWTKVKLGTRREQFREDVIKGIKFYTLTMYYDARITSKNAMLLDGEFWKVESADGLDGKKQYMEVIIKKGLGG